MIVEIANEHIIALSKCCYAICGVIAICGTLHVYIKMNNEEEGVAWLITKIVAVCFLLVWAGQMLKEWVTK